MAHKLKLHFCFLFENNNDNNNELGQKVFEKKFCSCPPIPLLLLFSSIILLIVFEHWIVRSRERHLYTSNYFIFWPPNKNKNKKEN